MTMYCREVLSLCVMPFYLTDILLRSVASLSSGLNYLVATLHKQRGVDPSVLELNSGSVEWFSEIVTF